MPALDGMTGIVLGAVFGALFVFTCLISAIKAVRDRSRIKKRIAEKVAAIQTVSNGCKPNSSIEETEACSSYDTSSVPLPTQKCVVRSSRDQYFIKMENNCRQSNGVSLHAECVDGNRQLLNGSTERLDLSVYSIEAGVDNITFEHSSTDIDKAGDNKRISQTRSTPSDNSVPWRPSLAPKRSGSEDSNIRRDKKTSHLPTDCLAVKKMMRRHSYEIAVCGNSWLPIKY